MKDRVLQSPMARRKFKVIEHTLNIN